MATEPPRIGTRIKRERERNRWSQQQLADRLGVNIKTIDNWENDRSYPRSSIGALEQIFGIALTDDDPPAPPPPRESVRESLRAKMLSVEEMVREMRAMMEEEDPYEHGSGAPLRRQAAVSG